MICEVISIVFHASQPASNSVAVTDSTDLESEAVLFTYIQSWKVQVQKVKVLFSVLYQSPGFANEHSISARGSTN